MFGYFSDLHVDLLAKGVMAPGEKRVGQAVVRYMPWWAFGFINKTYLVVATDWRVVLFEHRLTWLHQAVKLHGVESLPWAGVQEARVTGFFGKKLRLRGQGHGGLFNRKLRIPNTLFGLLAPMRHNVSGARAVASAFEATRALAAAPAYASLPPSSFAPSPQQQMATTLPSSPFPEQAPASLPPQNAPGYSSVRPLEATLQGGGIAPTPLRTPVARG